jgi:hypothetical protein
MTSKFTILITALVCLFLAAGCSVETTEPQFTGNLTGQVQNSKTGKGISDVSISTNPGTNVILTDSSGNFSYTDIPVGKYTITAEKKGFAIKIVNVNVERNKTATAQILLQSQDIKPTSSFLEAHVTNYFNHSSGDSSFVDVNYRVVNMSDNEVVPKYQVYFKIYTDSTLFYAQIKGDTLHGGQQNVGAFTKYLHNATADSVAVSGIYAPRP